MEAIDKIRDTATSHERLFLVEVMGRKCGWIALAAGVASGAEGIILPETPTDIGAICAQLDKGKKTGKKSSILIVAEGDEAGGAFEIAKKIRACSNYDAKVSVIGYQQRGGAPSASDRILASRLGKAAVDAFKKGRRSIVVGVIKGEVVISALACAWQEAPAISQELIELNKVLS
jgi:6-phosphofructokinase 1